MKVEEYLGDKIERRIRFYNRFEEDRRCVSTRRWQEWRASLRMIPGPDFFVKQSSRTTLQDS